jgi:hypothetical protein
MSKPHPHKGMSLSRKTDGGKGDKNRTSNGEKYREGYDAIDWNKQETKRKETK